MQEQEAWLTPRTSLKEKRLGRPTTAGSDTRPDKTTRDNAAAGGLEKTTFVQPVTLSICITSGSRLTSISRAVFCSRLFDDWYGSEAWSLIRTIQRSSRYVRLSMAFRWAIALVNIKATMLCRQASDRKGHTCFPRSLNSISPKWVKHSNTQYCQHRLSRF